MTTDARQLLDIPKELEPIAEKVLQKQRLSFDEGLALFESENSEAIRKLADLARIKRTGSIVYFAS